MRLLYFLFVSLLATLTSAVRLEGKIIPNAVINDLSKVDYTTARVALNGAYKTTRIQSDGRFVLYDIQPGSYMLEVHSIKYIFPKVHTQVSQCVLIHNYRCA
ncbi:Putative mRNA-capping enzyme subunit alpha [Rhizopus microsporus]|nr:Putative mRNA-capping enzyme subunit alpha [Rhizopus microsporus]